MGAIINKVAYSWSMLRVSIPGLSLSEDSTILQNVSAVSWKKDRKIASNYGIGGKIKSRGFGNETCEAKITLGYEAVAQLRALSDDNTLMGLGEFDLIISWVNDHQADDWVTETVTLKGCLFTEEGMDVKQDDTNIEKEYSLNPWDIEVTPV